MTAPRWTFTGDGSAWSVALDGVVIASSSSQKRATGDAFRRIIAALDTALDDYEDAELAATRLAAWSATVTGRA